MEHTGHSLRASALGNAQRCLLQARRHYKELELVGVTLGSFEKDSEPWGNMHLVSLGVCSATNPAQGGAGWAQNGAVKGFVWLHVP